MQKIELQWHDLPEIDENLLEMDENVEADGAALEEDGPMDDVNFYL